LIRSSWRDKLEKVVSVQSERNSSHSALMKLSDKSHSVNQKEVSFFLESEMRLKWQLLHIKHCIRALSLSPWESNYRPNMVKLISRRQSSNSKARKPNLKIKSKNSNQRSKLSRRGTKKERRLTRRREKLKWNSSNIKKTIWPSSLSRLSKKPNHEQTVIERNCSQNIIVTVVDLIQLIIFLIVYTI